MEDGIKILRSSFRGNIRLIFPTKVSLVKNMVQYTVKIFVSCKVAKS